MVNANQLHLRASEDLVPVGWGSQAELETLAARLHEFNVPTRIDMYPLGSTPENPNGPLGSAGHIVQLALYVEPESLERAVPVAEEFTATRMKRADLPSAPIGTELDSCPGCGSTVRPGVAECPECGLAYTPGWDTCHVCKSAVALDADRCPSCQELRADRDA